MSISDPGTASGDETVTEECSIAQVSEWLAAGEPIQVVDVREPFELGEGVLPGSIHIPLAALPELVHGKLDPEIRCVVYCQHGIRSLQATRYLRTQGWTQTVSMSGGFAEWLEEGLSLECSEAPEGWDAVRSERYASQLHLPELGLAGQQKLLQAKVLIVGIGGLGCPAATYLAAAGIGKLTIVDDDDVSLSNLPRQVLFNTCDVDLPKVPLAASALRAMNSDVTVIECPERLTKGNAGRLLSGVDVIVDASDNFETRFTISDAATDLEIPVVHGAVHRFEGLVTVFDPARGGPCLRCLHPDPPSSEDCPSCADAGVLGILPGLIGLYQSLEVIKILTGAGRLLIGEILTLDTLNSEHRRIALQPGDKCPCQQ